MKYLLVILVVCCSVGGYRVDFLSTQTPPAKGKPLILTPYIQNGRISEGRAASRVQPFLDDITSYSGFFTVNASSDGNLFFWYFPAENAAKEAPVMIWLQGGPGGSSMFGLFLEHGSLQLKNDEVEKRTMRWSQNIHMIYIDNPVGAGFSFSDRDGYATNEDEVSANLYEGLVQFFQLFPELSGNEFFVLGESYAGKYVPAVADKIRRENPKAKVKINLKGLAIGNGVVDPMPWITGTYEGLKESTAKTNGLGTGSIDASFHHFVRDDDFEMLSKYLYREDVQKQIHVNGMDFYVVNSVVEDTLSEYDWNTPVTPWVEELLNHYRILYYNGKDDDIIDYRSTENFTETLKWNGCQEYRSAKMTDWTVEGEKAGNFKAGGNLTLLLVNNAKHMVPKDQPKWAFEMVNKFVRNEPLA